MNKTVEWRLQFDAAEAQRRVTSAMEQLGTVDESTRDYVAGRVRFGTYRIKTRCSWAPDREGTRIIAQASSGDWKSQPVESVLSRLEETVRNLDVPGFQIDRSGTSASSLVTAFGLLAVVVFVAVPVLLRALSIW